MTQRRDFLLGGLCAGAAGAAYALVPRRRVSLLGSYKMAAIVPRKVADWTSRDVSDLVAPKEEDSLAARLYGETVGRIYEQASTGAQIMMLLAHGDTQSDDLQLHRPEVCYPAFGFKIMENHPVAIGVGRGVAIPGRSLLAEAPDRRETILYWSRLGEYLPTTKSEQHLDRTRTAMKGVIADGLLARFSMTATDPADDTRIMLGFLPALIGAIAPARRAALIGTANAQALAPVV